MLDSEIIKGFRTFGVSPYELGKHTGISTGHLYLVEKQVKTLGRQSIDKILGSEELAKEHPKAVAWFTTVIYVQKPSGSDA